MIALLGYNAMQIGLYGLFGAAASSFFSDNLHITIPWWVFVFVAMAIIAVLGYRQVDLSVKVLSILVSLEFLIVLILDAAILIKGGQAGTAPLTPRHSPGQASSAGRVAIALLFNFASFIGFEATTIYSEEAKDPKRTVPRATYVAVLTIGLFYTVTTYLMVEGQGAAGLKDHLGGLTPDPTAFLFELGGTYFGSALTVVMSLLFVSSVFAALLAFHNAVARYLFALGREGLVPKQMGRTHSVHLSPHIGSLTQTILAVVVVSHLRRHRPGPGAGPVHLADPARHLGNHRVDVAGVVRGGRRSSPGTASSTPICCARSWRRIIGGGGDGGGRHLRRLAVRPADRQSGQPAALDSARADRRRRGRRCHHRVQPEAPLAGVVRADGSPSRHRIDPGRLRSASPGRFGVADALVVAWNLNR